MLYYLNCLFLSAPQCFVGRAIWIFWIQKNPSLRVFPASGARRSIFWIFLASSIDQLNADVICLQEIKDENDFQELVNRLENYSGHRENSAAYNLDLAVLYLNDLDIISIDEIYTDDGLSFPRSPQVISLNWEDKKIVVINNHYKALSGSENEARRKSASQKLENYIKSPS